MKKNNKIEQIDFKGEGQKIEVQFPDLRKMLLIARALEHDLRKKIIGLLCDNPKMTVTEVYVKLKIEQSVASQHLAILRKAAVVNHTRDGKYIYYSLNKNQLNKISSFVEELL
jgi:DNA-binding transcriptional ArsR family regulator